MKSGEQLAIGAIVGANPDKERRAAYYSKHAERTKAYMASYYRKHSDRIKARVTRYYLANKERIREYKHSPRMRERGAWGKLRQYGLTRDGYDAILLSQHGGCAICGTPPNGQRLHVDHSHETGRVRGLLCSECNLGIGKFCDDPKRLQAAIDYLSKEHNRKGTQWKAKQ